MLLLLLLICSVIPPILHYQFVDTPLYNHREGWLHPTEILMLRQFGQATVYLPLLFALAFVISFFRPVAASTILVICVSIFALGLCSFVWLTYESVRFRQRIRADLAQACAEGERVEPGFAGGSGKALNFYYERIYRDLPNTLIPAAILVACSTILLLSSRPRNI